MSEQRRIEGRAAPNGEVEAVDDLAEVANAEHERAAGAMREGLGHALVAGAALWQAKQLLGDGAWPAWMDANLSFHRTTATWYMRIYHFRDELATADVDSFKGAMRYLRKHERRVRDTLGATQIQAIYALLDDGLGQTEIAARVGISKQGVHHHKMRRELGVAPRPRRIPITDEMIEITDEMIEITAGWLCEYLRRFSHPQKVTDQVRGDAVQLLNRLLSSSAGSPS